MEVPHWFAKQSLEVTKKPQRWHVIGLVSWGIGCGVEGRPAIYTNVFHYLDFIYEAKQILPLSSRLEPPLEQQNRKWDRN